ncbi:MAG: hypothetical protein EAZ35_05615 [Sphingobacteriia bacterium]|jgi:hypothetical protein|nr:MAG: hypothetical protein EAZ35_05615 [Sphingobacteriia bacterium]
MNQVKSRHTSFKYYLYAIWIVGSLFFFYLCQPFIKKGSGVYIPDIILGKGQIDLPFIPEKNNIGNQALVFVTINKKQFLTKFVTYISDEELEVEKQTPQTLDKVKKSFIIVGRKRPATPTEDFIIKSSPKI